MRDLGEHTHGVCCPVLVNQASHSEQLGDELGS